MINEDARSASAALVSFLQAFARLIAQEIRQQHGAPAARRVEDPPSGYQTRKLLNAKETADLLQVKLNRVYEIHWKGPDGLRCVRVGRQLRFRVEDIEAYLERQSRGGP